ncbi:MAG: hypothetical protein LBI04_04020 [Treponema sp.]|nr:hypothetical protein [Treponema sp.]
MISLFYVKWYIKRRTSASERLDEIRTEVYKLEADINAVTDRDLTLVEDRIKQLKEILDDTDKRIKVYVQELDRSRTGEALYTSLGRGIRAALKTPAEIQPVSDHEPELSTQMPKLTQGLQESEPAPTPVPFAPKPPSKRQVRTQIDELVKEGITPADIASRLGISIAEVDLAINLMSRKKS